MDLSSQIRSNPIVFADKILGLPLHPSQIQWIEGATKKINILRPGNRWGKSLVEAVIHTWQCMCKPGLEGRVNTPSQWLQVDYQTMNFGPGYEQAREVLRLVRDLVQGNILMPPKMQEAYGYTNNSLLKDWAIAEDKSEAQMLPQITFRNGAKVLGRSYSEMGQAFKMKRLAFISGDECADINELWTFTNGTLLPRLVDMGGIIHFVGTPQPEGIDYMQMIEMAEEDMARPDWGTDGQFYTQKGSMYDNVFLPRDEIERTERIADETLRKQIIYGEYVETGDKYFGTERVLNSIDRDMALLEEGVPGRKYLVTADFAGGESVWADYTACLVIDYTEEPYRIVNFWRIKGGDMPIPIQYRQVEDICKRFPGRLIIDATALGGKNAMAFLQHLRPIPMEISVRTKGEMLATLKMTFDGGNSGMMQRKIDYTGGGKKDVNPLWGLLRFPDIPVLVHELQNYKLDDTKLRTDCVMAMAQGIWWIEMRKPRITHKGEVPFDLLTW